LTTTSALTALATATLALPTLAAASTTTTTTAAAIFVTTILVARVGSRDSRLGVTGCVEEDVALVDPDLDADTTERRVCVHLCVVNVCAQGVQRNPALALIGDTSDFGTAQTTRTLHLDADRTEAHCALDSLLHGALVRDTLVDLLSDTLGHQL
jgi:hypothetical protein